MVAEQMSATSFVPLYVEIVLGFSFELYGESCLPPMKAHL